MINVNDKPLHYEANYATNAVVKIIAEHYARIFNDAGI